MKVLEDTFSLIYVPTCFSLREVSALAGPDDDCCVASRDDSFVDSFSLDFLSLKKREKNSPVSP